MDSLSEFGMAHIRARSVNTATTAGMMSGDEEEDPIILSDNLLNSASDFDSSVEKANYGEKLHRMQNKTKHKRKKKNAVQMSASAPSASASSSTVLSLYQIAQRNRTYYSDDEYDENDNNTLQLDEAEYRELFKVPYESAFTKIVTNEIDRELIEPYLHMHTDAQQKLLDKILLQDIMKNQQHKIQAKLKNMTASARFSRIEDQLRVGLRREAACSDLVFIAQLEQELVNYINWIAKKESRDEAIPLVLSFVENFYRFLCHGICQYYCLYSSSVDYKGQRVTVISTPKNSDIRNHFPSTPLHQYLRELTGKSDINPSLDPHSQESYKHEKLDALTFLANLKIDEDNDHTAYKPRRANKRKKYRKVAYGIKQR